MDPDEYEMNEPFKYDDTQEVLPEPEQVLPEDYLYLNTHLNNLITDEMTDSVKTFTNIKKGYFYNSSHYNFIEVLKSIIYINVYNCLFGLDLMLDDKKYKDESECKRSLNLIKKHYKLVVDFFKSTEVTIQVSVCKKISNFTFKGFFLKKDKINKFKKFLLGNHLLTSIESYDKVKKYFELTEYKTYLENVFKTDKCYLRFSLSTTEPVYKNKPKTRRLIPNTELDSIIKKNSNNEESNYIDKMKQEERLFKMDLKEEEEISKLSLLSDKCEFYKNIIYNKLSNGYSYSDTKITDYLNSLIDVTTLLINDIISKESNNEDKKECLNKIIRDYNYNLNWYNGEAQKPSNDRYQRNFYKLLQKRYIEKVLIILQEMRDELISKDSPSPITEEEVRQGGMTKKSIKKTSKTRRFKNSRSKNRRSKIRRSKIRRSKNRELM